MPYFFQNSLSRDKVDSGTTCFFNLFYWWGKIIKLQFSDILKIKKNSNRQHMAHDILKIKIVVSYLLEIFRL